MSLRIITCPEWGARPPREEIELVAAAERIIFHHTAGHHREIDTPRSESVEEAKRYARDIQAFHMDTNGWIDSGHNFLVTRAGHVLQGRWKTVHAIQRGRMVRSAHCPGQNTQIGIEHEHLGDEMMTPAQRFSSALLQAWIARRYGRVKVLDVQPHRRYFATSCPGNCERFIGGIQLQATHLHLDGALA